MSTVYYLLVYISTLKHRYLFVTELPSSQEVQKMFQELDYFIESDIVQGHNDDGKFNK